MKSKSYLILIVLSTSYFQHASAQVVSDSLYLENIKMEFYKEWPQNRSVNLVFHGHSVVVGYFKTPMISTFEAYPFLTFKNIKQKYPLAIINSITTAIGGENSEQGAQRFKTDVLCHRPDVLFIDYALNDRGIGLERAKVAWIKMIAEAKEYGAKIILLTPTPDLSENILNHDSPLAQHAQQIRALAVTYQIGLVDSYSQFKNIATTESLNFYMAQSNHINEKGHEVVAKAILAYFK